MLLKMSIMVFFVPTQFSQVLRIIDDEERIDWPPIATQNREETKLMISLFWWIGFHYNNADVSLDWIRKFLKELHKMMSEMNQTLTEGISYRLCFVTSLLSWTLLRFCVSESFEGKVLDLNASLILLGKWRRISNAVRRALFTCFSSFFV